MAKRPVIWIKKLKVRKLIRVQKQKAKFHKNKKIRKLILTFSNWMKAWLLKCSPNSKQTSDPQTRNFSKKIKTNGEKSLKRYLLKNRKKVSSGWQTKIPSNLPKNSSMISGK